MLELAAIKDKYDNIYYVIYYNPKYDELFVLPKYIKENEKYHKIKNIEEFIKKVDYNITKKSKYLKREAIILEKSQIKVYYNPIAKLKRIFKEPNDDVEKVVKEFVELIASEAKEELGNFGIGGSILVGLHKEDSDMDIAYYGKNPEIVYKALKNLRERGILMPLSREDLIKLYQERELTNIIEFPLFELLERRKIIEGRFKDRIYSLKFILRKNLEPSRILGKKEIEIEIINDSKSFFFPSVYSARSKNSEEYTIVSFKLRYCEMLKKGEIALVRGNLEKGKEGEYRIVIQDHNDFIKPLYLSS
ncbi:MAG: hypothetical protein RQ952_00255 [Thermoproteota archaeon]|jgi:predicted nucleotidyltransferase|nr:hypothetical protein [Thermoproteota archaeon]